MEPFLLTVSGVEDGKTVLHDSRGGDEEAEPEKGSTSGERGASSDLHRPLTENGSGNSAGCDL